LIFYCHFGGDILAIQSDVIESFIIERIRVKIIIKIVLKDWKERSNRLKGKHQKTLNKCIADLEKASSIMSKNNYIGEEDD